MIRHMLITMLCIMAFHTIRPEESILDIKVLCVTSPGERIELEGYEKKPTPFAVTGYKECYLFIKKEQPYVQQQGQKYIKAAAEEIVKVVHQ